MRSSKKRSRSSQNRPRSLGNIVNRVFDSSGPEGKVRGTPQQIIEKYQMLARDAQLSNDRVAAENFLQHAEHYTRMLAEAQREMAAEQEARQQQYQQNGGNQPGNGNGNGNGGNPGAPNGNRERGEYRDRNRDDYRDRSDRPDDRAPAHSDQPHGVEVIDFGGEDAGLVELPEVRPTEQPASHERREPRPQQQERRDPRPPRQPSDRQQSERQPSERQSSDRQPSERNEPRADRGPRPERNEPRPERNEPRPERTEAPRPERTEAPRPERREPRPKPVAVAQPELPAFITGTPTPAPAEAAEVPAKPKRARAPKKPAADVADVAGPEAAE